MIIGIYGNPRKPDLPSAVNALADILQARAIAFLLEESMRPAFANLQERCEFVSAETMRSRCDVVIAFGGDGTMLGAGRMLAGSNVPLLGVNLGKLGFLAEFSVDDLDETIEAIVSGDVRVLGRTLLEATFPDNPDQDSMIALNDIVIDKRGSALMLKLETYINGEFVSAFNADGLILATPTGSTAYALSVGGPVVAPTAKVLVIAPIAPHMLTARPVVIDDDAVIDVHLVPRGDHLEHERVHVYADGQLHRNIPIPTRVVVRRHEHSVGLVKRTSRTYFDVLRAKLLWGREPVMNERKSEE